MNVKYRTFNLICLVLSGFFVLGIVWMWRNQFRILAFEPENSVAQNFVKDQKIERSKNQVVKNNDPSVFQSSSLKIVSTTTLQISPTLPTSFNLAVAFTSQAPEKNWSEPWQDACEEAALLMLDAYYKHYGVSSLFVKDEILKMVDWEIKQGWGNDVTAEQLKIMAKEYFKLNLKIVENSTVEDLKKYIANGNPVLGVFDGKVLPNPHFQNGGPVYHALIIKGYDETQFITNDPGTQFGADFKYKYADLINAIHDWNEGDVKNGRKVILVTE